MNANVPADVMEQIIAEKIDAKQTKLNSLIRRSNQYGLTSKQEALKNALISEIRELKGEKDPHDYSTWLYVASWSLIALFALPFLV